MAIKTARYLNSTDLNTFFFIFIDKIFNELLKYYILSKTRKNKTK